MNCMVCELHINKVIIKTKLMRYFPCPKGLREVLGRQTTAMQHGKYQAPGKQSVLYKHTGMS